MKRAREDAVRDDAKPLTIGSLFAGIGGLELGLEQAGVGHTVWQVERDPFCRQVLAAHWPDATRYEDVNAVDWRQVAPVDVVCGGFPCQPFSLAGHQRGTSDDRWLWPAFADCLRVVRPRFVVVENVAALLADGDAFGWLLADLHDLGFDAEWSVVRACSVGAPHMRRRVFVLAHRPGGGRDERPHGDRQGEGDVPIAAGRSRCHAHHGGWTAEPGVGRVADGVPDRVDRLRSLGNAVVPAVAEVIGRRLVALSRATPTDRSRSLVPETS